MWIGGARATLRTNILLSLLGILAVLAMMSYSVSTWTHQTYTTADTSAFDSWRRIIPEDAEVLWPDEAPDRAWYSLHRASYWSLLQMAGMVFSRQDTMIGTRREDAVASLVGALGGKTGDLVKIGNMDPIRVRKELCAVPDLRYYVSRRDLGPTLFPPVTLQHRGHTQTLYLYHCDAQRIGLSHDPPPG